MVRDLACPSTPAELRVALAAGGSTSQAMALLGKTTWHRALRPGALVGSALIAATVFTSTPATVLAGPAAETSSYTSWRPTPAPKATPKVTFLDRFDGKAGTAVSSSRWIQQTGNGYNGWGNKELEYYTGGAQNAAVDGNGHLVITARRQAKGTCWNGRACPYTSARLMTKTKFAQAYGHFEARIRFDTGTQPQPGYWPAFWAIGANIDTAGYPACGEIDIMENYGSRIIDSTLWGARTNQDRLHGWHTRYRLPATSTNGWHTYGMDWTANKISFTFDGHVTGAQTKAQFGPNWQFNHPFFVVLNVAVGGTGGGDPTPATKFPLRMDVDYVKATST